MSKEIPLTRGLTAIVDDEDYGFLSKFKWYAHPADSSHKKFYARASAEHGKRMHRIIMDAPDHLEVDHINGNGLDNRRCNLRVCDHAQNNHNRITPKKYRGVYKETGASGYYARISYYGNRYYLGSFPTPELAALAYNEAAEKYYGEFARPNIINTAQAVSGESRKAHVERPEQIAANEGHGQSSPASIPRETRATAADNGLKPCPFCDGFAEVTRHGNRSVSMIITCADCGCTLESNETLISPSCNWNDRVDHKPRQDWQSIETCPYDEPVLFRLEDGNVIQDFWYDSPNVDRRYKYWMHIPPLSHAESEKS